MSKTVTTTHVPACCGWTLIEPVDNPAAGIVEQPVIAWLIETIRHEKGEEAHQSTHVTPITVEGWFGTEDDCWLLRNIDGTLIAPNQVALERDDSPLEWLRERQSATAESERT